jgi:hypothetical protein
MGTEGDKRITLKWMHCEVQRWSELAQDLVLLPFLVLR